MSVSANALYDRKGRTEAYPTSPANAPTAGFLTPPSSYNLDARRNSVASSQSSMSSFASLSDYSMPRTPTRCGQSPMTDDSFVDVMTEYDFNDMQSQPLHGLPLGQPLKAAPSDGSLYEHWTMVPHTPELHGNQAIQIQPHELLPPAGNFFVAEQSGMEGMVVTAAEPSWGTFAAPVHPDLGRPWDNRFGHPTVPDENQPNFWASEIHHTQGIHIPTMIPADSMLNADSDYIHVDPSAFSDTNTFNHASPAYPQSPEEVSFKKEMSPQLKDESDLERPKRSIHVSSTGSKTVKREQRSGGVSKQRSKRSGSPIDVDLFGKPITIGFDGCHRKWVEEKNDYEIFAIGPRSQKYQCDHIDALTGVQCERVFKRPEHMKRHCRTHYPAKDFHCGICPRGFGRNDNCQDHYWTHVRKPGKKEGRNRKMSLRRVLSKIPETEKGLKLKVKLRQKWMKDFGDLGLDAGFESETEEELVAAT